ncbi:hypothetical protein B0H34DRAFT_541604 [Crassisporium funariophilum]|nr:hypothetical protein B0H34DRAFT_541604 [Crassisporium funariophilum]
MANVGPSTGTRVRHLWRARRRLAPAASRRPKQAPWTSAIITQIRDSLNLEDSLDSAVLITNVFQSASRLADFTLPSLIAFDSQKYIAINAVRRSAGPRGGPVIVKSFR